MNKLYFLLILLLAYSCKTIQIIKISPSPLPQNRILLKKDVWKFTLQPFQNSKIFINSTEIPYKIVNSDKTLAVVSVVIPIYQDNLGFDLKITNVGYKDFNQRILQKNPKNESPVFVLDKVDSLHSFKNYIKVGQQPKSVTFINNNLVSLPLLNDKGIDIVDIFTGVKQRIAPPKAWAESGGFVESLVLKDRNELWISQMFRNTIHSFNLQTLQYQSTISIKGNWPKILSFNPIKNQILASNWLSRDVSIIDITTQKEVNRIFVNGVPRGLWIDPQGDYFYAALFGKENDVDQQGQFIKVSLLKDTFGDILLKSGTPGAKRHIIYSQIHQKIYLSEISKSQIEIYDLNGNYLGFIPVFNHPNTITITPDENFLYVSCRGPNNPESYLLKGFEMGQINVIDLNTDKVVETWEGGNQPTGLDISPDGRYIVFSDFLDHAIRIYERNNIPVVRKKKR